MAVKGLPPFDLRAFQPPESLWKLIESYAPLHEQDELKTMIGSSLVEESLELHTEVSTLLEIWQEYRAETESLQTSRRNKLPEPPVIRESLRQEIQFFVHSIRERAIEDGRREDELLSSHNKDLLDYAFTAGSHSDSRPPTSHGRTGKEVPIICSQLSDRSSGNPPPVTDEVAALSHKLNVISFDEVVHNLRERLADEVNQLKRDIEFLQGCLDEEATYRDHHDLEPSITDLKEERSKLEKTLLSNVTTKPGKGAKGPLKPVGKTAVPQQVVSRSVVRKASLQRVHSAKHDTQSGAAPVRGIYSPSLSEAGDADILRLDDAVEAKPAWPERGDCSSAASSRLEADSDYGSDYSRPSSSGQPDSHSRFIPEPKKRVGGQSTSSRQPNKSPQLRPVGVPQLALPKVGTTAGYKASQESEVTDRPTSASRFRKMVHQTRQFNY